MPTLSSPTHDAEATPGLPFHIAYLADVGCAEVLAAEHVLAVIRFGDHDAASSPTHDQRLWRVGLSQFGTADTLEVWYSDSPVRYDCVEGIAYTCNDDVLLTRIFIDEALCTDLDAVTYWVYRELLSFVRSQGYPHVLRAWNYFSDIHSQHQGLERYKAFCRGRYRAFIETLSDFPVRLPAASVIGTQTAGLLIYCLAAKAPGQQVENPRQLSAYSYPQQYGPRSPSFSRSVLKSWTAQRQHLYISGTASIVGHRTRHVENPVAQLQETLINMSALLKAANQYTHAFPWRLALLKVYVRRRPDADRLRYFLSKQPAFAVPVIFLQGDICRSELLVEVEGMAVSAPETE